MERRRVVITGMGAVTPIGIGVENAWQGVKEGKCGVGFISLYDTTNSKVKIAAEVKDFCPENYLEKREIRKLDRYVHFAVAAAKEAVDMSGISFEQEDTYRCGVSISSGIGGMATIQAEAERGMVKGYDKISPFFIPMSITNMGAAQVAIQHGLHGMCTCPVSACAGSANAIGDSFHYIRDGYAEVMLCGGSEAAITALGMGGFTSMKALSNAEDPGRASTPFDKDRSGFVMGEGAGVLVLEELEHARARGAKILGEVVGYGSTCDAYHITAPAPHGAGSTACMTAALRDADLKPEDVGYINAHGTSTPLNDACETEAVKTAFGPHAYKLMMSSTKSMTGHLLGASGGVEAVFSALALRDGYIPATIHYETPDEACDLDIVPNQGRNVQVDVAMSNSLGFGGHNASLILKRWED